MRFLCSQRSTAQCAQWWGVDTDGNVVVVNIDDNAVITYNLDGEVVKTEYAAEGGNDGVVVLPDGTKYVSSVRFGSVSEIKPGEEATIIVSGILSASMCHDSVQHQLVIPMNPNYSLAFIPFDAVAARPEDSERASLRTNRPSLRHHFCNQAVKPAKPGLKMVLQQGRTEAKVIFHAKFGAGYYEHILFLQQPPCQIL